MRMRVGVLVALLPWFGIAFAVERQTCEIPGYLLFGNNDLKRVAAAVKEDRRLTVAVVGTGSSALAGPDGPPSAYPARLEAVLKQRLPAVAVKVVTLVRSRQTAEDLAKGMAKLLVDEKPDLVIWQTGTIDAIRRIEPDDFRAALDEGIETQAASSQPSCPCALSTSTVSEILSLSWRDASRQLYSHLTMT